jgi:hypothetical protein
MSPLRTSPLSAQAVELQRWLLTDGDELRRLRTDVRTALLVFRLVDRELLHELPERVVLVATELAGNALRHGRPPAVVRLLRADGHFILDVADHDPATAPKLAAVHDANGGGRGLHIARSLSLEVCWYATEVAKHVWASFPMNPAAPSGR